MWLLVTLFVGLQYAIVGESFCWSAVCDCWWLFLLVCSIWLLVTHFNQWVSHLSVLSPPPMEVILRRCDVSLPLHKGLVWVMSHRWRCRAANSTAQCSTGTELSIWYSMSTIRGKIMGKGKGKPNAFRCTTHSICRGIRGVLGIPHFGVIVRHSYDMLRYIWYDMIYLLTACGLPPGDSSTVHIYTQTVHRTTQWNRIPRTEHT